jgi:putative transposase
MMPRVARRLVDGGTYHILNRGNGRQRVFHKDADYAAFLGMLSQMVERYSIDLYAYCLMPNHFHLVVKAGRADDLSNGMRWFTTTHVRRYHMHYKTSGHLWQGRYKSFAVEDDDHLLTVVRYVEGNPVRAGLVKSATSWIWSSHQGRFSSENIGKIGGNGSSPGEEKGLQLATLPISLPTHWAMYVDTPLSDAELENMK